VTNCSSSSSSSQWKRSGKKGKEGIKTGMKLKFITAKKKGRCFSEFKSPSLNANVLFFAGFLKTKSHPVLDQTQGSGAVFF